MSLPKLTAEQSLGTALVQYIAKVSSKIIEQRNVVMPNYIDFPYPSFPEKCANFLQACISNCPQNLDANSCRNSCERQLAPYCFLPSRRSAVINFLKSEAVEEEIAKYAKSDNHRVLVTNWWHTSPQDSQEHLTIEVTYASGGTDTCHVYQTGQWTCYPNG